MSRATFTVVVPLVFIGALAHPGFAVAQTELHEFNMPFALTTVNPCSYEPVVIEGTLDLLTQITIDQAGGFHVKTHVASKGRGFSPFSKYVYSEEDDTEVYFPGPSSTFTSTSTLNHLLTSASATDNFLMKITMHTTVANGVPTASVQNAVVECRG